MELIERKPIPADLVDRLGNLKQAAAAMPNLFPSEPSIRHFLRTRRSALMARGLVYETTLGLLIDIPGLRAQVLEILQEPPTDIPVRGRGSREPRAKT